MQCPNRNTIYTVDKKAIQKDKLWLITKDIVNNENIYRAGNGNWDAGVEEYYKGKQWVFFNTVPSGVLKKTWEAFKLLKAGYMKFNEVGCGKCEICRTEKSKEWGIKAECESRCWKNKTFFTFTYNGENLPSDRKLRRSDLQGFWKRLRYHLYKETKSKDGIQFNINLEEIPSNPLEDTLGFNSKRKNRHPIRYLNCGEYGPKTKRPHYHAIVWNFKPDDLKKYKKDARGYWLYTSEKINKIWGMGYVIIGNATTETAQYVARYTTKKYARSEEEQEKMKKKKQNEFIGASSWGFIGYYYWINHKENIKKNGGILMKSKKGTHLANIPKAMQKKWEWEDEDGYEEYKMEKEYNGKQNWKKILAGTTLSEEEYILETYRARTEKLKLLKRNATELGSA